MLALQKLEVLIRGNSTVSTDGAIKWTKSWVNARQESDENKDEEGNYKVAYYADLFDSRNSSSWKVFCDKATEEREISNKWICEDGTEVEGVITVFIKKKLIDEIIENIDNSSFEKISVEPQENPFIYENDCVFIVAETDEEMAELRVDGNKIYIYDASAFAENKQLLDLNEHPLKLTLLIFK